MNTSCSGKKITLATACALALGIASGAAQAQNFGPNDSREIWTTTPGVQVWKNGYGECWHSAFGPPPSYNECNPAPVAQYVAPTPPPPAPYVAPAVIQPAPAVVPAPLPPKKPRG